MLRDPYDFRPLAELDHQDTVQFRLFNGNIIYGRMLVGIVTPASRTYYHTERGERVILDARQITGWRELLDPDEVLAWRKAQKEAA